MNSHIKISNGDVTPKYAPVYRSTTAEFHSSHDLRRQQQNNKKSFFK